MESYDLYFSADGGSTYKKLPEASELFDIHVDTAAPDVSPRSATVTFSVNKIHIGALKPVLGQYYSAFRRRHLSERKHKSGRWHR